MNLFPMNLKKIYSPNYSTLKLRAIRKVSNALYTGIFVIGTCDLLITHNFINVPIGLICPHLFRTYIQKVFGIF